MYVPPSLLGCECCSCSEAGCSLDLTGLGSEIHILSMNRLKQAVRARGQICDCGILWVDRNRIAAVELKGGHSLNIAVLVRQLQGGLNLLDRVLDEQSVGEFIPILLYQGRRDPTAALAGRFVEFRGEKRRIVARKCGSKMSAILRNMQRTRRRRRIGGTR